MKNPSKATFVHSSMYGSYTTPCKILIYGEARCSVSYVDPVTKETIVETMKNKDLTFKKEKKAKKKDDAFISVSVERDLYFKILQCCIDRQETIEEFFMAAVKNLLKEYEEAKKKGPEAVKALKARIKGLKKVTA